MKRWSTLVALLAASSLASCQVASNDQASRGTKTTKGGGVSGILRAIRPEPVLVPEGTALPLVLETAVSSATNKTGDLVVARLASDVRVGEKTALPEGTEFRGRVTAADPSGHVSGRAARLAMDFDTVVYKGRERGIETRAIDITGPDSHKKNIEIMGGSAAGGAIIGALVGGKKGAGIGLLAGGAAGTGVVLAEKGKEVSLPAGTRWTVKLSREARLD